MHSYSIVTTLYGALVVTMAMLLRHVNRKLIVVVVVVVMINIIIIIIIIRPRQMSSSSIIMNNGVKSRESQLYQNLCDTITTFKKNSDTNCNNASSYKFATN